MRRGIACVLVAFFAQVAGASATYLCVPSTSIPGCPTSGSASESTVQDAFTNAAPSGDTILIASDAYNSGQPYGPGADLGKSVTVLGAGPTKTLIQAKGTPGMGISWGSTVSGLGIEVYPAGGNHGLDLAGHASNVAITAQPGVTYAVGVDLNGGTFSHGSVSLPMNVSEPSGYGGVIGAGTLSDSSIAAAVGIADDSFHMPTVHRVHVFANEGVLVADTTPFTMDDSVIRTVHTAAPEVGVGASPQAIFQSFDLRHVTIVGSNTTGSTGISAYTGGIDGNDTSSVLLDSSIVRGYGTSVAATADGLGGSAATTVTIQHSYYDPSGASKDQINGGVATITADSHSGNINPLYVNPAHGDFHLQAGSPAIDAGAPTLGTGESTTDLDGHPRLIAGHNGDAAISDIGAYEFIPHAPIVTATATELKIAPGRKDTFQAKASPQSPGDAASLRWNFGDGGSATGTIVSHAFAKAGRHHVTVTATDLDGFTDTVTLTITVPGPALSKLTIKPPRFRASHGATITYTASQAATTTFKVVRTKTGQTVMTFAHKGTAGPNQMHFAAGTKRHKLAPGGYQLTARPHNAAGTGGPVSAKFTIAG
jgi:hypothetical protein